MGFAFPYPRKVVLQEWSLQISYPEFSGVVKNTLGVKREVLSKGRWQSAFQREHASQTAEKQAQSLASGLHGIRSLEVLFKIPFKAILSCLHTFYREDQSQLDYTLAYLTKGNFQEHIFF